ncbi:hypothetical protein [Flavobacterium psychrophilum]|uniref:hypothetical protein n=1 Tax=Flavobacterium psychrophilum TaxID=96345 RepID=UPI001068E333|nr:hypothetical protein [Flavobacterium psychrophilum]
MTNEDYNHQEKAYHNYLRAFYPTILFKETIYKDLYSTLIDENLTRASMGDYYYEKYLNKINENIKKIEIEITNYIEINSLKDDAKEYLLYFKPILEIKTLELLIRINQTKEPVTTDKDTYKSEVWFKVGLLFARGEMEKFYTENRKDIKDEYSAPKIAEELGNIHYQKTILATMKEYTKSNSNGNKNIYNSLERMKKIINHCNEKQINIIPEFIAKMPTE